MQERIIRQFNDSIETLIRAIEPLTPGIEAAALLLSQALLTDRKILCCGHGPAANTANQFATYLMDRFNRERPGLPVVALGTDSATLSAIGGDFSPNEAFSRPIRALGQAGDVLLAATDDSNAPPLLQALRAAHDRDMAVILLSGEDNGDLQSLLTRHNVDIRVPSRHRARIQEIQLLITHCLCDLVEYQLFGDPGDE